MKIGYRRHRGFESRSDRYPCGRDFGFEAVVELEHDGPAEEYQIISNHLGRPFNAVRALWADGERVE